MGRRRVRVTVDVYLWNTKIGTLVQANVNEFPVFRYDSDFIKSGIEVSPLVMPLSREKYVFKNLPEQTFKGLPGLLADSLPDKYGTKLIDDYLTRQGRTLDSFSIAERLCYVGNRGIGALEYRPSYDMDDIADNLNIDELADLASSILSEKETLEIYADDQAISQLLAIGTSAGGARAKALIAWNEQEGIIKSGQIDAGDNYTYWLLKFGTITNNRDHDAQPDDMEYSKIEFAYSLMAKDAGITMPDCRLLKSEEGFHFLTKRFDRTDNYEKIHMQSMSGLAHYDFNNPGETSIEELAQRMKQLHLSQKEIEQFFRRNIFNDLAKNYDDHVKNISCLMDKRGKWSLSPAYDITFSYKPDSPWVSKHNIYINGKRDNLTIDDFIQCGKTLNISKNKTEQMISDIISVLSRWPEYAEYVHLSETKMEYIKKYHNLNKTHLNSNISLNYLKEEEGKYPKGYSEIKD